MADGGSAYPAGEERYVEVNGKVEVYDPAIHGSASEIPTKSYSNHFGSSQSTPNPSRYDTRRRPEESDIDRRSYEPKGYSTPSRPYGGSSARAYDQYDSMPQNMDRRRGGASHAPLYNQSSSSPVESNHVPEISGSNVVEFGRERSHGGGVGVSYRPDVFVYDFTITVPFAFDVDMKSDGRSVTESLSIKQVQDNVAKSIRSTHGYLETSVLTNLLELWREGLVFRIDLDLAYNKTNAPVDVVFSAHENFSTMAGTHSGTNVFYRIPPKVDTFVPNYFVNQIDALQNPIMSLLGPYNASRDLSQDYETRGQGTAHLKKDGLLWALYGTDMNKRAQWSAENANHRDIYTSNPISLGSLDPYKTAGEKFLDSNVMLSPLFERVSGMRSELQQALTTTFIPHSNPHKKPTSNDFVGNVGIRGVAHIACPRKVRHEKWSNDFYHTLAKSMEVPVEQIAKMTKKTNIFLPDAYVVG